MNEDPRNSLKRFKVWGFFLLVIAGLGIWLSISLLPTASKLPIIGVVPDWTLLNQVSQPFGSKDLAGRVYIANFVFTRCPSVCPKMMDQMAKLTHQFADPDTKVYFVSFTVDPEHDTPQVLKKYAFERGINAREWSLLTSESKESLFKLYSEGFKIGVSQGAPVADLFDIAHSEKMVLVDQQNRIRGFYGHDNDGLAQIAHDARVLEENP